MIWPWSTEKTGFQERLTSAERALFHDVCPPRRYPKNSCVFRAGDPAVSLHLIDAGQVKLVAPTQEGKERILAVCGPGDLFGEAFLSGVQVYQANAVTATEVLTCAMSRAQFLELTKASATFALAFAEALADQLAGCRTLLGSGFDPVRLRVARVFTDHARRYGVTLPESGWYLLDTHLTHEDVAALVTATRVAVSKALAELRRAGLVEGARGRYLVDVVGLEALLGGSVAPNSARPHDSAPAAKP